MREGKIFRPTWGYWLKSWAPITLCLAIILMFGVRDNVGTEKFTRVLGATLFIVLLWFVFFLMAIRQQIVVMSHGFFVQTWRKSYYWSWEQILYIDFYGKGEESKPHLYVKTEENSQEFEIYAFDEVAIEDAVTEIVGVDEVGWGAYRRTEWYRKAREKRDMLLQRWGEEKRYIGGSVNYFFYIFTCLCVGGLLGLAFLFLVFFEVPWLAVVFVLLAFICLVRMLSLVGEIYFSRDHIVCKRPFQTHMIWWREVTSLDYSKRMIIFRGINKTLLCPGIMFWPDKNYKRMNMIFNRQCEERQLYAGYVDIFDFSHNKNVKTSRFDKRN